MRQKRAEAQQRDSASRGWENGGRRLAAPTLLSARIVRLVREQKANTLKLLPTNELNAAPDYSPDRSRV